MEADVVAVHEEALDAVGGDAGGSGVGSVGGVGDHDGNYGDVGPLLFSGGGYGGEERRVEGRAGGFVDFVEDGDGDLVVGYDAGESLLDVFNGVLGEDAAVDVGGGELGQGVDGVAAFELGGDASGAEYGVPRWGDGSGALEGGFRAAIEAVEGL